MARTVLIWTFGILGFGFAGAVAGMATGKADAELAGFVAGFCVFACVRLWLAERTTY